MARQGTWPRPAPRVLGDRPAGPARAAAAPVGTILLLPLADADGPTGLTEVGWHLHPDHQGQGLATEAAAATLAVAAEAGLGQVLAMTDPDNIRSQAVAARLGMRNEGITERWLAGPHASSAIPGLRPDPRSRAAPARCGRRGRPTSR